MSAVFNCANTQSAIRASGPCVRILGLNLSRPEATELSTGHDIETRVWHMSSEDSIFWRPITNTNLSTTNDFEESLKNEYDSVPKRLSDWNAYRSAVTQEVLDAAKNHVMRPVLQVRAMFLLAEQERSSGNLEASEVTKVPQVSRASELRGQSWALIGIVGDASYETSRADILDRLGLQYFEYLKTIGPADASNDDLEAHFMLSGPQGHEDMLEALKHDILKTRNSLQEISKEPMVAFFDVSEDPEALQAKSQSLVAKVPSLLHADLAVVRMYSWIKLDYKAKTAKAHTSRDPKANDFYKSMAQAS